MRFDAKLQKKIFAFVLSALMFTTSALPGQMALTANAAEGTETGDAAEEITLQSVRDEAKARYETDKMGFDLSLSEQSFTGSGGLDYSSDTQDRAYMETFNNLKDQSKEQTIIFRFKTTVESQFIFGTGVDGSNNGKNMTFSLQNGTIRFRLRNSNRQQGGTKAGLQGNLGTNLNDGKYHTVAISFCPEPGYAAGNVRFVIDGGDDLYPPSWCPEWKAGFNQNAEAFTKFHIASSALYGADGGGGAFNGTIDFITVIDKAYTVQELQSITQGDKSYLDIAAGMMTGLTCHKWLFTGGTEGVADFAESKTTRNWVGLFEDNLRNEGSAGTSYIIRARFVFNTAKKNAGIEEILSEYDTRILPYKTKTVGFMTGASDYQKGTEGLDAFVECLSALVEKLKKDDKYPLILTPYPSRSAEKQKNIRLYAQTIMEKAEEWGIKAVDLSGIETEHNVSEEDCLTPVGHQTVANAIKNALGLGRTTNFSMSGLSDGSYTVAKKTESGEPAQIQEVTAQKDSIAVSVDPTLAIASGEGEARLEYALTDTQGNEITASVETGKTAFNVEGLKQGETYTLRVYDAGRDTVKESYQPVCITVAEGEKGINREYEDGNISENKKIQALLSKDEQVTYLFMGDSITHGIVTNGYDNVPQMFAKYLYEIGREEDVVLNTGVSNATLATTLEKEQIKGRLMNYKPDAVMIMLGTNDTSNAGENTVNEDGSTSQGSITVEEFVNRYKELIRKIYETNPDAAVVLRVPCDMAGQLVAHEGYEEKFAAIEQVAEAMREETGMDITVVNHLEGWRDYRDHVRNDNIRNSGYGWLVNDGIHPNGRGNLAMFQQIIKELGLYVPTSELANYQYELSEWTDVSAIEAPVTQKGSRGSFAMSALSGYANGLRNVTLTLTEEGGRSISKTEEYAENSVISVSGLDAKKTYTASVTGTDNVNSKEITFAASYAKERDTTATEAEKAEYDERLNEAKEADLSEYPNEIQDAYNAALAKIEEEYANLTTVDQIDAALTAIRLALANANASLKETTNALDALAEAVNDTKVVYDGGRKDTYIEANGNAYKALYEKASAADKNTGISEIRKLLTELKNAEQKLLTEKKPAPDSGHFETLKPEQGKVYTAGDYSYRIISVSAHTAEVAGVNGAQKKLKIGAPVTIGGESFAVVSVGASAFKGNKTVTEVTVENPVTSIGNSAFEKCTNLKKVEIKSAKLTKIGKKAFMGCKKLKKISIKSKALKSVGAKALKGTHAKLKITAPKAKYKVYVKKLAKKGQGKDAVIK